MAISTTRAKQIRKNFRKNYGPKPAVTTMDIKPRRRAVIAREDTYMKKDTTMGKLTRAQKLRTMQNLNKRAKKVRPGKTKPPIFDKPIMTYPNADDMTFVVGRPRPGKTKPAKKRPGKTQPGIHNPKLDGTISIPAKKKMRGGGVAKKKMMRGGVAKKVQPKRMRGGGMAKMAKKKMMRGGMAKKK